MNAYSQQGKKHVLIAIAELVQGLVSQPASMLLTYRASWYYDTKITLTGLTVLL